MPDMTAPAVINANLREAMRFFGEATGKGGVEDHAGIRVIDSGIDYPVFNISVFSDPPLVSRLDLDERLREPAAHFRARRVRWSHWVCVDLLPPPFGSRPDDVFARHGLRRLTDAPAMLANAIQAPVRPLPPLRVQQVEDAQSRLAFAHITSISFDIPFAICREVYEPEHAWNGLYQGYIGYYQQNPVCTAALVVAAGAIGIYSVGTLPTYRRRGVAETLLRNILARVSEQTGIRRYILQSTRAGFDLYRRMGFETVGRFAVYIT
jgi:ribosomal protein S18 acetylase RimI-like enzyme